MNLLEIIVIAVTILLAVLGYRRGFIKKLASMLSLVLSVTLVSLILPYMTEFLKENTPVYDYIVSQCESVVTEQLTGSSISGSSSVPDTYQNMGRDQIKSLMEQNGYDSAIVDALSDDQLEEYKEQYIQQYAGEYFDSTSDTTWQPGKIEQQELIESLPLPQVLKDLLTDNNNAEGYKKLEVTTFQDYVIQLIATVILNVLSFIAAVIVVRLILWGAILALDFLSHIPVINIVNHLAGLLLGLVQALFFLWLFFLILSMASATEIGLQLMDMVQQSTLLSCLFESNLFMKIVVNTAALFV
jgi:hypothetical protein